MVNPGELDLTNITLRDLRELEAVIGKPIGSLFEALAGGDMSALGTDLMAGLFWVRLRKDDPSVTIEDVWDMDLGGLNPDAPKARADATA